MEGFVPVVPIFSQLSDFNRVVLAFKRKNIDFAVFYERAAYPLKQFLAQAHNFPGIFVEDAEIVDALRGTGYAGDLYLFSNFFQLAHPGFFKEYKTVPVVTGRKNYESALAGELAPVYVVSDKSCIADFGLCVSRKGAPQCFYNCDSRCRERSKAKSGLNFPVSIKPENRFPDDSSVIFYSENIFFPDSGKGELREQILENCWNYRFPIGKEILKPGTQGQGKSFHFVLDSEKIDLYEKGLIGFYGYKGTLYKGSWIEMTSLPKVKNGRITVPLKESYEELLMVVRYNDEEKKFLKNARHFIFTLPEGKVLEEPIEETNEPHIVQKGQGRFSKRAKLTLISDDSAAFASFKGKYVERKVLVFKRDVVGKYYSDYILLDGVIGEKDVSEIMELPKLKGIVVKDGVLKIYLERIFPDKEILLHPLSYAIPENAPSFLSASTTVFTSIFKSDRKRNYSWTDMNIYLKHRRGSLEFVSRKKLFKKGRKKELWVDIAETTDEALKFLKTQAENFIRTTG